MSNESKCRDCGETLVWDDKVVSASGKKIPLEKNGNKHQCPFSKFNKTQDKSLGDRTPMEAVSYLMNELTGIKKRLDGLEIDKNWGQYKTGTVPEPKKKIPGEIDWDAIKAETEKQTDSKLEEKKSEIDWDKYKT